MDVVRAGEDDGGDDEPAGEAELVPRAHHPAREVEVVVGLRAERDLERTVARRDRLRVIPLHVVRLPVVQVDRLPVRVVPRVEAAPVDVELVTEDKLPLLSFAEVGERVRVLGRVAIDEAPVPCEAR